MKSVKMCIIPRPGLHIAPSVEPAGSYFNEFWNDFWFRIILPVRAELAPTAVR